ncbi:MAG: hypothetical protein EPN17_11385 [Methylobacter sp.]|nr:MAG: hypothetical protein EPN17_11385 [Methylobacter sp.]
MSIKTGLRTSTLPIEHLDAELLAAPFAYNSAFAGSLIALDPKLPKSMIPLWRQTERDLLSRFPGMSVDELIIRRDQIWFEKPSATPQPAPLGKILQQAAYKLINADAGRARPLVDYLERTEADQRRYWRWLTFSLPADLLLAAAGANFECIDMVSARLRFQLAEGGLVEPHLHLKAAISFPELWSSLMRSLALTSAKYDILQSPGAEWDEGRGLAPLLLRTALARLVLAGFLADPNFHQKGFNHFLEERAIPELNRRYGTSTCWPLWQTLSTLIADYNQTSQPFFVLRELYRQLTSPSSSKHFDPISLWFPETSGSQPDFGFTRVALDYLATHGKQDTLFAKLFWQTVRSRVLFYRHVVQRPMIPGVQWFSRTYNRLSPARKPMPNKSYVKQAVKLSGSGLRALEVRITPEDSIADLLKTILDIDAAMSEISKKCAPKSTPNPELGIIFHLSRTRGEAAEQGRPAAWASDCHDDPSFIESNPSGYRYSGYYRTQRTGAMTLANLLMTYPRMLERVRGIDLCTDELGVPLWVLKPLIQHIQKAANEAAKNLQNIEGDSPSPLGVTVHAGEDFVHLLGGIRRVDEAVEFLKLGEGSRIGHAVALGIDVREWAMRSKRLLLPRGERLFDLLWAWRVARRVPDDLHAWLPWIDQELGRISQKLFNQDISVENLNLWYECLYDTDSLRQVGFPDGPRPRVCDNDSTLNLVHQWLTNRSLFRRAQELETINIEREMPLIIALQAHVRKIIGMRGIVVEINPSSNLLIGHLGDLTSHPLWRLCPPAGITSDAPSVRVCIGSDDPITFATSLPEEYQLLADALTEAGIAGPAVDAWLEAARECGLTTRFTVPRSKKDLAKPMCANTLPSPL